MGRSTVVVIWLALVALALRPIAGVDRAARLVFEPARLLARAALPFAVAASAEAAAEAQSRARELLLAEQEDARPAERALDSGRGLIHAQVIDRTEERADLVVVHFPLEAAVEPGMPVVCGAVYVGSVVEVGRLSKAPAPVRGPAPLAPGEARVRLVTAEGARVGARAGTVELVAGGLARTEHSRERPRLIAVRALQSDPGPERAVLVHEDPSAGGPWSTLAEGYRLGTLVELPLGPRSAFAIEPLLDYRGGFSQVFVLCPPERALAGALLAQDPFDEHAWRRAQAAPGGGLSPWRETRRLLAGTRAGLAEGAAVARGTEFVGRIVRADLFSSDVECLGDPGFRLLVLAGVPGRRAPLHLGRVLSLGTDVTRERVFLAWDESAAIARELAAAGCTAELYSSSGERGIPPGLHLGTALLPCGAGPHVLVVQRTAAAEWGTQLEAWIGERAEEQSP